MEKKTVLYAAILLFFPSLFSFIPKGEGWGGLLFSQDTRLWATYYGGAGSEHGGPGTSYGNSVATDASGNVYLSGMTGSAASIASGGFQNAYGGGSYDAFLVKFDESGNRLWATYYGGAGEDWGRSIAIDVSGNVYMAGYTNSVSGIASGGFQNTYGGGSDAFLVKFDTSGSRLWATYYGGTGTENGYSVSTNPAGNVYLSGRTNSISGIASGGFQNTYAGGDDTFLVKFDASGGRLWATYYGGTGSEDGYSIATDVSGNVYLVGGTTSISGIASGGFQNTFGGPSFDAFLVKFDANGSRLWATYYGGTTVDHGSSVATDPSGNVYLAGYTNSAGIALGGFQNTYGGGNDAFLVKFDGAGTRLWATYYGGMGNEYYLHGVTSDVCGNVYLTGRTSSDASIASGGFQNTYSGGDDAFLVKFDGSGNRLCATYYGETGYDYGYNIAVNTSGSVYLAGWTGSASGIASGGFQNAYGGGSEDAFLVKFTSCGNNTLCATATSTNVNCNGQCSGTASVNAINGIIPYAYSWSNGQTTQTITGLCASTYSAIVTDSTGSSATAIVTITSPAVLSSSVTLTNACNAQCNGSAIVIVSGGTPGYTYLWNTFPTQTTANATGLCAGTFTCSITDANGCTTTQTITIVQSTVLSISASGTNPGCNGGNNGSAAASVTGGSFPYTYSWSPSGGSNASASGLTAGTYTCTITDNNGCVATQTLAITQPTAISINTSSTSASCSMCPDGTASVTASGGVPGYAYLWNTSPGQTTQTATGLMPGTYTICVTDTNGCAKCNSVTIIFSIGINETSFSDFILVYPNPAAESITVEMKFETQTKVEISLQNILGEQIYTDSLVAKQTRKIIPVTKLPGGMYFIEVKIDNGIFVKKFIRQ